ncbi:MAG: glycosyltransferase [Saprospiraceae bacterium]
MTKSNKIIVTVSNDLNQDQRMFKICTSLTKLGYDVVLIGRTKKDSLPLRNQTYQQKRLFCFFEKGFLFYAEFNFRLLLFLFRHSFQYVYSVDLDTLLPGFISAKIFRKKNIFDAHEYFTETPEIENRWFVKAFWNMIANICIPKSSATITVNESLATLFSGMYGKQFHYLYNTSKLKNENQIILKNPSQKIVLYQGVLNQGRGLELLIDVMPLLPEITLHLVGEGDLSKALRNQASHSTASDRIVFKGWLFGEDLTQSTREAWVGINILDASSKNYYYSLANKFFDYLHAELPSINMAFPEYNKILGQFPVGITISLLEEKQLVQAINLLIQNKNFYNQMQSACKVAKQYFQWSNEEAKLENIMNKLEHS